MKNCLTPNVKSINAKDQLIDVVLDDLFSGTDVKYTIIDRKIILAPEYLSGETVVPSNSQQQTVSGTISDVNGVALAGVNVMLKGSLAGAISDINGKFLLNVPDRNGVLVFSFIGYTQQEVPINGTNYY